jgi:hypothetical protein
MKHLSALLPAVLFSALSAQAQYCSPNFVNGCSGWNTMSVSMGTTTWFPQGDCTLSDQTATSMNIVVAQPTTMIVENGAWCGCAVWVDLDNSGSFEDSENLYTIYTGGSPSYQYSFSITIPAGTAPGTYRMRLISPWGSDGVTPGDNGYGPCGNYQYGNFEDFSLNVSATAAIGEAASTEAAFSASPNPTNGLVHLTALEGSMPEGRLVLESLDGRVARTWTIGTAQHADLDLSALPAGIYLLRSADQPALRPLRLVKQ